MRFHRAHLGCWGVALLALVAMVPAARAQNCGDSCLKRILHRYLVALPTHNPSSLPLAAQVQARENSEPVNLGEGSWQSVTAVLPGYIFADPESGNVIYGGGVRRGKALGILFLRLKVIDGKIADSEMLTSGPGAVTPPRPQLPGSPAASAGPATDTQRSAQRFAAPDLSGLLTPDILYDAILPKDRRSTRQQLMRIPFLYMQGLAKGDGSIPPFGPRCDRWAAGGRKLTNNPAARGGAISCATAIDGMKRMPGRSVTNRRVVVADVAHGIAVGMLIVSFDVGGMRVTQNAAEIFKVVDGHIRSIEEFNVPGRVPPGSGFAGQDDSP
jgi:hypothetical protein